MPYHFHRLLTACLLAVLFVAGEARSADKLTGIVLVKDAIAVANQPTTVEAELLGKGLLTNSKLGGEPLELVVNGEVVSTAMTGGDGRALLSYISKKQGLVPVIVRIGASPRVAPAEGQANVAVWERRSPIVAVELAALVEDASMQSPVPGIGLQSAAGPKPQAEAADELGKLTQFYYRVIYVASTRTGGDPFETSEETRAWLKTHHFPAGYVLALRTGEDVGARLDELHAEGWKTVKTGVGRTKAFAEAFLSRRLEAVIVPEPKKGDAPRRAKIAKDWRDVRKKL